MNLASRTPSSRSQSLAIATALGLFALGVACVGFEQTEVALAVFGVAAGVVASGVAYRAFDRREKIRVERLEQALQAGRDVAEARTRIMHAVAEASPLALLFYTDNGRIVYANACARQLFFENQSPEGKNFLELIASAPEPLKRALLGESDELFSVEVERQQETYHVSRRAFDLDGAPHTLLLVRHLTREISRREVEVLKTVIRVISHELNNSLAPVASLVHSARLIAQKREHLEKLERVFDTIEERSRHLSDFLEGYAKLARLPKPRLEQVAWASFTSRFSEFYPNAKVVGPSEGFGYFDPTQVEQVLINLLKNANESGGSETDVELVIANAADGSISLEVRDRGNGFTAEALQNAFLPLYTTKQQGGGMGLALCREVAEAHGGRLHLQNRDGGGSVAALWLPGRIRAGELAGSRARLTLTRG